jgi:hypothetical protein
MPDRPRKEEPMAVAPMTREELLALPATVDIVTGARAFGIGRTTAYELARADEFPCKILRFGTTYRVITADMLRVLHVTHLNDDAAGSSHPTAPVEHAPLAASTN